MPLFLLFGALFGGVLTYLTVSADDTVQNFIGDIFDFSFSESEPVAKAITETVTVEDYQDVPISENSFVDFFTPFFIPEEPMQIDAEKNLFAFLSMIRKAEGNPNYNQMFGYAVFGSYDTHPNIAAYPIIKGKKVKTTAAGAYQITYPTWKDLSARTGLTDFSPATQDAMAIELLRMENAYNDVISGRFDSAVRKVSNRWASLPYSSAGQNKRSLEYVETAFINAGGIIA